MAFFHKCSDFSDKIAKLCYKKYFDLSKTGKPNDKEWTVLSCIVQSINEESLEVVSLGTGSKCVGGLFLLSSDAIGDFLHDSHAEVMARRGFLRYLYDQIDKAFNKETSIFEINIDGKFALKPDIYFHFFSTQKPCGDATIVSEHDGSHLHFGDTKLFENESEKNSSLLGRVRRKPGKGDLTLSVSCSDKLARWIRVGIQGALLDILLDVPISLHTIIIGGDGDYCETSLRRALLNRNSEDSINFSPLICPQIIGNILPFCHRKMSEKQPCPSSLVWCKTKEKPLEIAVNGKKQGATKKKLSKSSQLLISKKSLVKKFLKIIKLVNKKSYVDILNSNEKTLNYKTIKQKSLRYYNKWSVIKDIFFKAWSPKSDKINFCISE